MDGLVWGAVLTSLLVVLVLRLVSRGGKTPPGPVGLPIVGYLPFLSELPHLDLQRLSKKYGDVFSIRLGRRNVLVLSDYQITKETYAKDALMGRPPELPFSVGQITRETEAFLGLPWREQRKFAVHMLKDLGFGKSKMERLLQEEILELLAHFEQTTRKSFSIRGLLAPSMSNNIGTLMFGKRFKYDDPVRKMMNEAVKATALMAQQVSWLTFFPLIKNTLQFLGIGNLKQTKKAAKALNHYIRKEIDEHEKTFNPDNIRDFIDGYLLEMKKKKDNPAFCKDVLEDIAVGFFNAGSDTVRMSVEWLILLAASLPDARHRIQVEIDDVTGRNRLLEYPDLKYMPFTEAFIMELNRWRTITPLNVLRYTLADIEVSGYYIPKHTIVINNLWAIHHDKKYWGEDADEFRPERFLTEDTKAIKKWERYIPFSTGKRACPGEPLAKVEVFLYFVSIMQRFDVKLPEGKTPDFEGILDVGLQPKVQEVILTKRM